jgi:adenylosuccinate lyase
MIARYSRPEMTALWEAKNRYQTWLTVELAACESMAKAGLIPASAPGEIAAGAEIDVARIDAIERETQHDVIAFVSSITERVGEAGRYLHWGMTSSDVLDTALALLMRQAADLLLADIDALLVVLKERAEAEKWTLMIGRSHGIHGEPITFGWKMALWYEEMRRHKRRLREAEDEISFGKLSGSMGTYAHLPPEIEADMCVRLGLRPEIAATQVIPRDRHARYLQTLALIAASIEKFATEIRHLQRTEVGEVEEPFQVGQKGSSSMPHKRNPIASENLCGLARLIRSDATAALENVSLWHERDISHSSVERVIVPDATILLDYMLHRFTRTLRGLVVYPDRMRQNMNLTGGTIYSQAVLLLLVEKGMARERAYDVVQSAAMQVFHHGGDFKKAISDEPEVTAHLTEDALSACFDPKRFVRHIDGVYDRIFNATYAN